MPEAYGYSEEWGDVLRRLVRVEMVRRDISFVELSRRLARMGIHKTPKNLSMRVSTGAFGAQLLLMMLVAMGCRYLDLSLVHEELAEGRLKLDPVETTARRRRTRRRRAETVSQQD